MELEENRLYAHFYRIFALILIAILISPTHTFAETFIQAEKNNTVFVNETNGLPFSSAW